MNVAAVVCMLGNGCQGGVALPPCSDEPQGTGPPGQRAACSRLRLIGRWADARNQRDAAGAVSSDAARAGGYRPGPWRFEALWWMAWLMISGSAGSFHARSLMPPAVRVLNACSARAPLVQQRVCARGCFVHRLRSAHFPCGSCGDAQSRQTW